jgi:biopolymer transport protein ExbD
MKKARLLLFLVGAIACTEAPKTTDNTAVKTDSLTVANRSLNDHSATDSLVINVDSTGNMTLGNQKVDIESLTTKLTDSLQSIKKQYGKLPDTIICRSKGDVLMGTRGAIKDAIMDAKEKVNSL